MRLNKEIIRGLSIVIVLAGLLIWLIIYTVLRSGERGRMILQWAITLPVAVFALFSVHLFGVPGLFLLVLCAVILSAMWAPHVGALLISPLTNALDGGNLPPEARPMYSIALSKKHQGRYFEAVTEIRRQLDRFPADLEGHMLLAEILAEHLNDLPGAELTLQRWIAQPGHAPKNITFALYALADWHLQLAQDREAARQCLQKVIDLLPGTEFANGAAQRIAHLGDAEMLLSPLQRKKFLVPEGSKYPGLAKAAEQVSPLQNNPERMAADYVKHLEQHPLDMEAREKLAVIYASHYKRMDLAASELEQMSAAPNMASKRVVHWLNLLADLQIQSGAAYEEVRETLQRIIDRFPGGSAAELARSRLSVLNLELKANQKTGAVKLGVYEQRLGLKKN